MSKLTIYQKPACTTCRNVMNILKEAGVDYEAINYYINPISKSKLKSLLKKMGLQAKDILRTKEPIHKKLKLVGKQISEDELIDLMIRHPDLIQRPIVEKGTKAILARPPRRDRARG
ncbi:MAG: glutaredoxin family protein, partial [Ignavibacteriae bacterium]|nr:glutaredoxin family protein [Ignavibacteriota bacterium]